MDYKNPLRPTIGVLAGWPVFTGTPDSFLGHVFRGIQAAAGDRNCNLLMACGIDSGRPAWPLLSPEVDFVPVGPWNTDGLIIVSPFASEAGERYARDLIASGFPAIFAGDRDAGPAVVADNVGGIRQALEHLVKHGHRQIAFVAGRQSKHSDSDVRLWAFETEFRSLNLRFNPNLVAYGSHNYEGGRQAIQQIINRGEKFTAVIASNDRSAIGVLDGLRKNGFVVPQDIALIGFDDRLEARALAPSLTTVHYPMFGLGYQAVELLLRAIKGEPILNELVRIPTRLVIRESCGCLPGLPASVKDEDVEEQTSLELTREQVVSRLTRVMTVAVHNESLWLSQKEVTHLVQRLVEAFLLSLEQKDPLTFHGSPVFNGK
ncbi:MAG: substrate-binding domain-containing protein [Anaerolineae bacterium]|nr:substrate-binding domain-containing protein [Anaerolineae bacterium]